MKKLHAEPLQHRYYEGSLLFEEGNRDAVFCIVKMHSHKGAYALLKLGPAYDMSWVLSGVAYSVKIQGVSFNKVGVIKEIANQGYETPPPHEW